MSGADRPRTCGECGRPTVRLQTRLGVREFDAEMIDRVLDEAQLGFVLRRARVHGTRAVVGLLAVPVRDVAERHLERVERVAMPHLCREYRRRHPVYNPEDDAHTLPHLGPNK